MTSAAGGPVPSVGSAAASSGPGPRAAVLHAHEHHPYARQKRLEATAIRRNRVAVTQFRFPRGKYSASPRTEMKISRIGELVTSRHQIFELASRCCSGARAFRNGTVTAVRRPPSRHAEKETHMSELAVPSANDSSKNCTQPRSHSTGLKIGLVLIGLALVVGGALNWHWLVAAGLLPIIVGLLPCAAMCALHLCSGKQRQQ